MKRSLVVGVLAFVVTLSLAGMGLAHAANDGNQGSGRGQLSAPGQISPPGQVSPPGLLSAPGQISPPGKASPPGRLSPPGLLSAPGQLSPPGVAGQKVRIDIRVIEFPSGRSIQDGARLREMTTFQVVVVSSGAECAGQFAVTALGAPGLPPSVLVQTVPFVIGPGTPTNAATGEPLNSGIRNDWKVSATCNGASRGEYDASFFEFWVQADP